MIIFTYIYSCNRHPDQDIKYFQHSDSLVNFQIHNPTTTIQGSHYSDFYYHRFVWLVLEFPVERIIQYVVCCVWLFQFTILFVRFIDVVVCSRSLLFLIDTQHFIVWTYHNLSVLLCIFGMFIIFGYCEHSRVCFLVDTYSYFSWIDT